jgi:hypothetical protein
VRDSIAAAKQGIPSVAFVTNVFWAQGNFVAKADGMPTIPRIELPHPVAGSGQDAITALAQQISDDVIARLTEG